MAELQLESPKIRALFGELYGRDPKTIQHQIARYSAIQQAFAKHFPAGEIQWFSTPGRTEISGNHTDHNAGKVLAASIDLDSVAAVVKTDEPVINVFSQGFPTVFSVNLSDLKMKPQEKGTTAALIRGIANRFRELGYAIGGFNAAIASDVMVGSGLSSSASVEVLLGAILNSLYNKNKVKPETIAMVGQYAENVYFGKPCGLMDQMTCAVGNIVTIDFEDAKNPKVRKINFDFNKQKYRLIVVDTGGNHADLTDDYASIPQEMKSVAAHFGKKVCREISLEDVANNITRLRKATGDRAVLRALHFLEENKRVVRQVKALQDGKFTDFLSLVTESGNSSFKWLQNCYTTKNPAEQGISMALAMTQPYLDKIKQGACRVHGGGFAGTIQVFLPQTAVAGYVRQMEKVFGEKSIRVLSIRPYGSVHINGMLGQTSNGKKVVGNGQAKKTAAVKPKALAGSKR
jgi:galactokinase